MGTFSQLGLESGYRRRWRIRPSGIGRSMVDLLHSNRSEEERAKRQRRRGAETTTGESSDENKERKDSLRRKSVPVFSIRLFRRSGSSYSLSSASSTSANDVANASNDTENVNIDSARITQSTGNVSATQATPTTPAPPAGDRLQLSPGLPTHRRATSAKQRTPPALPAPPSSAPPTSVAASTHSAHSAHSAPSKARHKKFQRHFGTAAPDERVLNYYSCALVGDILLQGHLYITSNYFAFYSNVFGYVTKLLIPTASVCNVSKENLARIIPNAIGVTTPEDKHVFGSLLSRDNTYKLMLQVWKAAVEPCALTLHLPAEDSSRGVAILAEDDDSSLSGSGVDGVDGVDAVHGVHNPLERPCARPRPRPRENAPVMTAACTAVSASAPVAPVAGTSPPLTLSRPAPSPIPSPSRPTPTLVLAASTALLVLLFASAAVMLYRISCIQFQIQSGEDMYRWQSRLHMRSASQVEDFLDTHLDQLAKVRQSLEALSLLIVEKDERANVQGSVPVVHQRDSQPSQSNQFDFGRALPRGLTV